MAYNSIYTYHGALLVISVLIAVGRLPCKALK